MTIIDKIISKKPREIAGSLTQNAFDYQLNFSALIVLEMLDNEENFIILLDYLDDLVVLDDEENPKQIIFYQVKTNTNNEITLATMINNDYLKNMNENNIDFENLNTLSFLASNSKFKINAKNARKGHVFHENYDESVKISDLLNLSDKKEELINWINSYLGDNVDLSRLYLLRSSLPLQGQEEFLKGKLHNYLLKENNKFDVASVNILYLEFVSELRRLSSTIYNSPTIKIEDLFDKKAFSKKDFDYIEKKAFDVMIPIDGNKVYVFAKDILKHQWEQRNLIDFNKKYNEFSIDVISSNLIHAEIIDYIKKINLSDYDDDKLVNKIKYECDNDVNISNYTLYKEYKDILIVLYLYKIGEKL